MRAGLHRAAGEEQDDGMSPADGYSVQTSPALRVQHMAMELGTGDPRPVQVLASEAPLSIGKC